jgi:hypothetical protein
MNRLRIQYASGFCFGADKVVPPALLKPVAPVLAIPQHVTHRDFLHFCSRNWDDVFVIGNRAETTSAFKNVHYLNRRRLDRYGVAFLGVSGDTNWLGTQLTACRLAGTPVVVVTDTLPLATALVRPPVRAWIAGVPPASMILYMEFPESPPVQYVVNTRAKGYCREIFVDISTEPGIGDTRDPDLVAAS